MAADRWLPSFRTSSVCPSTSDLPIYYFEWVITGRVDQEG
jgi:hypothetical protein